MSKRSGEVILTKEAIILKRLRLKHKLTMKEAGKKSGMSDTMIGLLESGRAEIPKATDALDRLLKTYGDIEKKYFYELVRNCKEDEDDLIFLTKVLHNLNKDDLKFIRQIVELKLKR